MRLSRRFQGRGLWHDGGADFGVPLTNYLGWLLTSWMFYQVFALSLLNGVRCAHLGKAACYAL